MEGTAAGEMVFDVGSSLGKLATLRFRNGLLNIQAFTGNVIADDARAPADKAEVLSVLKTYSVGKTRLLEFLDTAGYKVSTNKTRILTISMLQGGPKSRVWRVYRNEWTKDTSAGTYIVGTSLGELATLRFADGVLSAIEFKE
jgi:hypothetical protein